MKKTNILLSLILIVTIASTTAMSVVTAETEPHVHEDETSFQYVLNSEVIEGFSAPIGYTITKYIEAGKNYYLEDNLTLNYSLQVTGEGKLHICLNGHILNLNGHVIRGDYGCTEFEITDCTETCHKYTVANNKWVLDEENGTEKVYGGVITDHVEYKENQRYGFYGLANEITSFNNVNFVGIDAKNVNEYDDSPAYTLISASKDTRINNCQFIGNYFDEKIHASLISNSSNQGISITINNCVFKDNYCNNKSSSYDSSIIISNTGSGTVKIYDTVMTGNKFKDGAIYAATYCSNYVLGGKIVIENNGMNGDIDMQLKYDDDGTTPSISIDNEKGLDSDSSIGIGYKINRDIKIVDSANVISGDSLDYSVLSNIFHCYDKNYFFSVDGNSLVLKPIIEEQPSATNNNTFILDNEFLDKDGVKVNYTWHTLNKTEVKHDPLKEIQNYLNLEGDAFKYADYGAIYQDGKWNIDQEKKIMGNTIGVVKLQLNKDDFLLVEAVETGTGDNVVYSTDGIKIIKMNKLSSGKKFALMAEKTGIYYIVVGGNGFNKGFSVYKMTEGSSFVNSAQPNKLNKTENEFYICKAEIKKNNNDYLTLVSNVAEVELYEVKFVYGDSKLYTRPYRNIVANSKIPKPEDPSGWHANKWYKEEELINEWDFNKDVVTADTVLYAEYEPAIDIVGDESMTIGSAKEDTVLIVGAGLEGLSLDNFKSIIVDGKEFSKSDLEMGTGQDSSTYYYNDYLKIENGCLKVTISKEYMNKLAVGTHNVQVKLEGTMGTMDLSLKNLNAALTIRKAKSSHYKIVNTGVK